MMRAKKEELETGSTAEPSALQRMHNWLMQTPAKASWVPTTMVPAAHPSQCQTPDRTAQVCIEMRCAVRYRGTSSAQHSGRSGAGTRDPYFTLRNKA